MKKQALATMLLALSFGATAMANPSAQRVSRKINAALGVSQINFVKTIKGNSCGLSVVHTGDEFQVLMNKNGRDIVAFEISDIQSKIENFQESFQKIEVQTSLSDINGNRSYGLSIAPTGISNISRVTISASGLGTHSCDVVLKAATLE